MEVNGWQAILLVALALISVTIFIPNGTKYALWAAGLLILVMVLKIVNERTA